MLARIGFGHQHFDIAPDQLLRGIAEDPLGRMVNRADRAVPVDDHDPVDRGVDDRAIEGVGEAVAVLAVEARLCRTQLPDPRHFFEQEPPRGYVSAQLPLASLSNTMNWPSGGTDNGDGSPLAKAFDLVALDRIAGCRLELRHLVAIADENACNGDGRVSVRRMGMKLLAVLMIMHMPVHPRNLSVAKRAWRCSRSTRPRASFPPPINQPAQLIFAQLSQRANAASSAALVSTDFSTSFFQSAGW